jgi:hypothetical protein
MTYEKFYNILRKNRLFAKVTVTNSDRCYFITDRNSPERSVTISPSDGNMVSISFTKVDIDRYPFKSLHLSLSSNKVVFNIPLAELQTSMDVNILLHWVIAECFLGLPKHNLMKRIWIWIIRAWQHFLIKVV